MSKRPHGVISLLPRIGPSSTSLPKVCRDPEGKYGEDWRDNHDLCVYKGTEAELRELFAGTTGWLATAGRNVLDYIA